MTIPEQNKDIKSDKFGWDDSEIEWKKEVIKSKPKEKEKEKLESE